MTENRTFYSIVNNLLNLFPPYGSFLNLRGKWTSRFLKKAGNNLKISSFVNIYKPEAVRVGDNVYIGYNTYIGDGDIKLDDEVIIGPFCSIVAGNHTIKNGSFRYGKYQKGKIEIGRGSWLCSHVTVTSDVRIGEGCLVAANSVVTEDVKDFTMVGGVPATFIKKINNNNA